MTQPTRRDPVAVLAAALAFASAAVTLFWLLGGTLGLDTLGGEIEELGRERSRAALAVLAMTLVAKVVAGWLAFALAGPRSGRSRALTALGLAGGAVLALYGGLLVLVGALVLTGAIDPGGSRDEYALRWHVFFWDLWFLVWGVALATAAARARLRQRANDRRSRCGP